MMRHERNVSRLSFGPYRKSWDDGTVFRFLATETIDAIEYKLDTVLSQFEAWAIYDVTGLV